MNPEKERICIVVPCLYGGGAERAAIRLSLQLCKQYDVAIVNLEEGLDYPIPHRVQRRVLTNLDGRASPIRKFLFFPIQLIKFRLFLNQNSFNKVISFTERASLLCVLSDKKRKSRLIVSFRNFQSLHLKMENFNPFFKAIRHAIYGTFNSKICKYVFRINALSKATAIDLEKTYKIPSSDIHVIYNEYDISEIVAASHEDLGPQYIPIFENPTIVTMGRLVKQKGQWHLIRTFAEVVKKVPNAKLVILGTGPLLDYFKKLCSSLNLKFCGDDRIDSEAHVFFLGFQKNPHKLVNKSTLFAFPSLWEGFGNALLEAMACETVIVSGDCLSGPREMLAPDTDPFITTKVVEKAEFGILVPPFSGEMRQSIDTELSESEEIWSDTLIKILTNPLEYQPYRLKALQGSSRFDTGSQLPKWLKLLND